MSNETNRRVAINSEEELDQITGGNVLFVMAGGEAYLYGSHNPEKKYAFCAKVRDIKAFIADNYDYYGESGIFDAMKTAGLIADM